MTKSLAAARMVKELISTQGHTHHTYGTLLRHRVRLELLHHLLGVGDGFAVLLVRLAMSLLTGYVTVVDGPAGGACFEVGSDPAARAAYF